MVGYARVICVHPQMCFLNYGAEIITVMCVGQELAMLQIFVGSFWTQTFLHPVKAHKHAQSHAAKMSMIVAVQPDVTMGTEFFSGSAKVSVSCISLVISRVELSPAGNSGTGIASPDGSAWSAAEASLVRRLLRERLPMKKSSDGDQAPNRSAPVRS